MTDMNNKKNNIYINKDIFYFFSFIEFIFALNHEKATSIFVNFCSYQKLLYISFMMQNGKILTNERFLFLSLRSQIKFHSF